jgi:hypothetical protein
VSNEIALPIRLNAPLDSWLDIVSAIRTWANRSDWTDDQCTEFIDLAERRFNRVLRVPDMEEIATTALLAGNNDLPADCLAVRAIYQETNALEEMSIQGLIGRYGTQEGIPQAYALVGSSPRKVRLAPSPNEEGVPVNLIYYKRIGPLRAENPTNWFLEKHADLYLYQALLMSEVFAVNDERVALWESAVDTGLKEIMDSAVRDEFGGGPLTAGSYPNQVRGVRV